MKTHSSLRTLISSVSLIVALAAGSVWFSYSWMVPEVIQQFTVLAQGFPLVVRYYSPMIIIGLSAIMVLIAALMVSISYFQIFQRSDINQSVKKVFSIAFVAVFTGAVFAVIVKQWMWVSKAQSVGFQPCPMMSVLSSRGDGRAWVIDPSLCEDKVVKKIVRSGSYEEMQDVRTLHRNRAK